jgi:hypothetical protein
MKNKELFYPQMSQIDADKRFKNDKQKTSADICAICG